MDKIAEKIRSISKSRSSSRDGHAEHHDHGHSHLNPEFADSAHEPRGREAAYVSSGRGGAGNFSHSRGRQPNPNSADEDAAVIEHARSASRGRHSTPDAVPAGRGGAGNIRSPSRDPGERAASKEAVERLNEEEQVVMAKHDAAQRGTKLAGGRGGFGNIATVPHEIAKAGGADDVAAETAEEP